MKIQIRKNCHEVSKVWGKEVWIENDENYCLKFLHFNPEASCSLHFHLIKLETFVILKGQFCLTSIDTDTAEENTVWLNESDCVTIPRGTPHRLFSKTGGTIIEASTQHFDTDSYRIKKSVI